METIVRFGAIIPLALCMLPFALMTKGELQLTLCIIQAMLLLIQIICFILWWIFYS